MIAESASAVAVLAARPDASLRQRHPRQLIPAIRRRRARGRLFQRSLTAEAEPNLPCRWPQRWRGQGAPGDPVVVT